MELLIYIAVIWILAALTGWLAWVGYLRLRMLKIREKQKFQRGPGGGVFIPAEEVDDGNGDRKEAFNEQVAQMRGRWESGRGQ